MGVDVFGRGTYGGGGMACAAAAQVALRAGTSLALFAPGWVLYAITTTIRCNHFLHTLTLTPYLLVSRSWRL
jgi:hypothetical protein